jgi:hypothetical protein
LKEFKEWFKSVSAEEGGSMVTDGSPSGSPNAEGPTGSAPPKPALGSVDSTMEKKENTDENRDLG